MFSYAIITNNYNHVVYPVLYSPNPFTNQAPFFLKKDNLPALILWQIKLNHYIKLFKNII